MHKEKSLEFMRRIRKAHWKMRDKMTASQKTIGLLGGMSWESTALYYQLLNEGMKRELGGLHSAKILLHSFDFAEIEALQMAGKWDESAVVLAGAAKGLEAAGADMVLICTNTMHKLADQIEASTSIPLLHIADATAAVIKKANYKKVGLLGTRFTMEHDFYKGRLENKHGIDVLIPDDAGRTKAHDIIYEELCLGVVKESSKAVYLGIIKELKALGAEAIILGCTEIGMLIKPDDTDLPVLDTTSIHAGAAVKAALKS